MNRTSIPPGLCTSSGVACYFKSEKENGVSKAREKEVVPSSIVTRRRSYRVRNI
ncbi:hypothetical protein A2U01_0077200, partial [Trifolium medium]|nr:hypothetical protein [Trifolium medium]